jgi:ubiquinone/menaquinone biosynthesis C-methylase UbiE
MVEIVEILDVGCGDRPKGDVNLDLFRYGKWKNLVIAEAQHLPFRDKVFIKVHSKHCLEHLENPLAFFREARRVLKKDGVLECIYPTDTMLTKKTIHNLLNLRWISAFKWKQKLMGVEKINYGGHKWQLPDDVVSKLLKKAAFTDMEFQKIVFPTIRMDLDRKKNKWKISFNRYLPKWQIETKFVAKFQE